MRRSSFELHGICGGRSSGSISSTFRFFFPACSCRGCVVVVVVLVVVVVVGEVFSHVRFVTTAWDIDILGHGSDVRVLLEFLFVELL